MTDAEIQRLHEITESILQNSGQIIWPTSSKIRPFLYMMMGEVWCGIDGQHYVYICDSRIDARDMAEQFTKLLDEDDESYARTYHFTSDPIIHVIRTGQTFHFISYQKAMLEEYWNNMVCDRVYINVQGRTYDQLTHLHMDILKTGADYI